MPDRAQVLAYAAERGAREAARHFGIPYGTVASWRRRQRQRHARAARRREAELADRMAELVALVEAGGCLHCGGTGRVQVAAVKRGDVPIRPARLIDCPTCGGIPRRLQVTAWPRQEWEAAMARAGDLGAGWLGWEWRRILAGEPNPAGQRWTHHDRLVPDGSDFSTWEPYQGWPR